MSIESVVPSNHFIICHPLLLLPTIVPSIRVFSNESALQIRWSKYWSFSFSISPFSEYSGLIPFRIDWFDLLAVQGTLKSFLQYHISKASIFLVLSLLYGPTWGPPKAFLPFSGLRASRGILTHTGLEGKKAKSQPQPQLQSNKLLPTQPADCSGSKAGVAEGSWGRACYLWSMLLQRQAQTLRPHLRHSKAHEDDTRKQGAWVPGQVPTLLAVCLSLI